MTVLPKQYVSIILETTHANVIQVTTAMRLNNATMSRNAPIVVLTIVMRMHFAQTPQVTTRVPATMATSVTGSHVATSTNANQEAMIVIFTPLAWIMLVHSNAIVMPVMMAMAGALA